MSYISGHLILLSNTRTVDGWPVSVTEEGKKFATSQVRAGLVKHKLLTLDLAKRCIYDDDSAVVPDCLKGVLWDWLYAITYRALLAVDAEQVFMLKNSLLIELKLST